MEPTTSASTPAPTPSVPPINQPTGATAVWCAAYTNTADLSPEDLATHWGTVTAQEGYAVPATIADETALFLRALS